MSKPTEGTTPVVNPNINWTLVNNDVCKICSNYATLCRWKLGMFDDEGGCTYVDAGHILEIFIFSCAFYLNVLLKSL